MKSNRHYSKRQLDTKIDSVAGRLTMILFGHFSNRAGLIYKDLDLMTMLDLLVEAANVHGGVFHAKVFLDLPENLRDIESVGEYDHKIFAPYLYKPVNISTL